MTKQAVSEIRTQLRWSDARSVAGAKHEGPPRGGQLTAHFQQRQQVVLNQPSLAFGTVSVTRWVENYRIVLIAAFEFPLTELHRILDDPTNLRIFQAGDARVLSSAGDHALGRVNVRYLGSRTSRGQRAPTGVGEQVEHSQDFTGACGLLGDPLPGGKLLKENADLAGGQRRKLQLKSILLREPHREIDVRRLPVFHLRYPHTVGRSVPVKSDDSIAPQRRLLFPFFGRWTRPIQNPNPKPLELAAVAKVQQFVVGPVVGHRIYRG